MLVSCTWVNYDGSTLHVPPSHQRLPHPADTLSGCFPGVKSGFDHVRADPASRHRDFAQHFSLGQIIIEIRQRWQLFKVPLAFWRDLLHVGQVLDIGIIGLSNSSGALLL